MKKVRCNHCGYEKLKPEQEMFDSECDICIGGIFEVITEKAEKKWIEPILMKNNTIANQLKQEIKMLGYRGVWNFIENIGLASKRVQYRQIFFEVGGKVPEKHLIKFITKHIIGKPSEKIWLI